MAEMLFLEFFFFFYLLGFIYGSYYYFFYFFSLSLIIIPPKSSLDCKAGISTNNNLLFVHAVKTYNFSQEFQISKM